MYIYILYVIQIVTHLLLIYALLKKVKKNKSFWSLIVFNFSIILWVVFTWLLIVFYNYDFVILFVKATFAATSLSLGSFLVFVWLSIKKKFDFKSLITIIVSVFFAVFSFTDYLVESVGVGDPSQLVPVNFGSLSILFVLYILCGISILLVAVLQERKKVKGLSFLRLRYIIVGMIVGGLTALSTNVIIPAITGVSSSAILGPIAMSVISLFTTYSYIQNRLFGIKFLVNKALYSLMLVLIPYGSIFVLLYLFKNLKLSLQDPVTYLVIGLFSLLIVFSFPILRTRLEKFLMSTGDLGQDPSDIREEFLKNISTELNIDMLGILTLKAIDKIFDLKKSGVVIFKADNASIIYKKLYEFGDQPLDNRDLLQAIYYWEELGHSTIITKDELSNSKNLTKQEERILYFMEKDQIEVILPLNRKVHLNGVVVLGGKNNRNPFTVEDINYLESLIINSSVAFSRSILYKQVHELNSSLKQKVAEQTQELRTKVKQLEEARRKEADMIDIMGHELRTPMSIVKLNTDLLHQFTDNVIHKKEDFVKYVKRIKDAVDTEIKLINTLLSSAKLEGNKIDLNREEVDIVEQIKMSLHAQESRAEKKGLTIRTDFEKGTPSVFGDHARIVEILNNLIDNAVKYTERGSILVKTETEDGYVRTSIIDTGPGMSEEDISRLGTKFFRTSNYINSHESDDIEIVRPGGTGLGLYVTFNLVKRMEGEIHVESELGKGSNFTFTLPRYNGQKGKTPTDSNDMFEKLGLKKEEDIKEKIKQ